MMDLPPHPPVFQICIPALQESWERAEACLLENGFSFQVADPEIERMEREYLALQDLESSNPVDQTVDDLISGSLQGMLSLFGESDDGDKAVSLPVAVVATDYDNSAKTRDRYSYISKIFESPEDEIMFLVDGDDITSFTYLSPRHWPGFDSFVASMNPKYMIAEASSGMSSIVVFGETEQGDVVPIDMEPTATSSIRALAVTQAMDPQFEDYLGTTPLVRFAATYEILRE